MLVLIRLFSALSAIRHSRRKRSQQQEKKHPNYANVIVYRASAEFSVQQPETLQCLQAQKWGKSILSLLLIAHIR
jgi:hypothetical protein